MISFKSELIDFDRILFKMMKSISTSSIQIIQRHLTDKVITNESIISQKIHTIRMLMQVKILILVKMFKMSIHWIIQHWIHHILISLIFSYFRLNFQFCSHLILLILLYLSLVIHLLLVIYFWTSHIRLVHDIGGIDSGINTIRIRIRIRIN